MDPRIREGDKCASRVLRHSREGGNPWPPAFARVTKVRFACSPSFPRRRESMAPRIREGDKCALRVPRHSREGGNPWPKCSRFARKAKHWIPACAGMTSVLREGASARSQR